MRVAITGGTGMIGTALAAHLRARGDDVYVLSRTADPARDDQIQWDPHRGVPQPRRLEGLDAVVNLTGAPLATRPWTRARRVLLRDSRVRATESLLGSLEKLDDPPSIFVGVAALGVFGDRGDAWIDDDDPPGEGFLAELSAAWEGAHLSASERIGARAAVLRLGVVLSHTGGAFPLLVGPFRHGFGGWLGHGRQFTPWVSLDDAVRAFTHLLDHDDCRGGFNGNLPEPVRNRAWAEAMGRVVGRPVHTHAPQWALRGALGELAGAVFLASVRARPRKLLATGFTFHDTDAETFFRRELAAFDAS